MTQTLLIQAIGIKPDLHDQAVILVLIVCAHLVISLQSCIR